MQMDEGTQQNAALVEQAAAASQAIVEQAMSLNSLVSQLPGPWWLRPSAVKPARAASRRAKPAREAVARAGGEGAGRAARAAQGSGRRCRVDRVLTSGWK